MLREVYDIDSSDKITRISIKKNNKVSYKNVNINITYM